MHLLDVVSDDKRVTAQMADCSSRLLFSSAPIDTPAEGGGVIVNRVVSRFYDATSTIQ